MSTPNEDGTITIHLSSVKEPDEFLDVVAHFGPRAKKWFEFGEYATLELVVSKDGTFTGEFLK